MLNVKDVCLFPRYMLHAFWLIYYKIYNQNCKNSKLHNQQDSHKVKSIENFI